MIIFGTQPKILNYPRFYFTMQEISSSSKDILILALIGSVLPGVWLAYRLNLFEFFDTINDKNKILLPSFLFLFGPFFVPFISRHPLPGALSSIIPVITFILGQILVESNNKKMLSDNEKEVTLKIEIKLSSAKERAKINKQQLENYLKNHNYLESLNNINTLENITEELNQLLIFQELIQTKWSLDNNSLIRCIQECEYLIEKINQELTQKKIIENDIKDNREEVSVEVYNARIMALNSKTAKNLRSYINDFIEAHDEFYKMFKIKKN